MLKVSDFPAKGAQIEDSDLFEISDYNGATYDTKSVTGANIRPFKTLIFNISQVGTGAPTVNYSYVGEVTQTFTFARTSIGMYTLTANNALFTNNKTFVSFSHGGSGGGKSLGAFVTSTTVLTFYTSTYLDVAADTSLDSANLQITIIK